MSAEILRSLGQVAGIGGVALGTFLLIARAIIRKDIFPRLNGVQAFRLLRLCLVLAWSVAIVGIFAWLAAAIRERQQSGKFVYHTAAIQNLKFIYSAQAWPFDVDTAGEDSMSAVNERSFRAGLVTVWPLKSKYPRIPAGEAFIEFTLENRTNTLLVVDRMELELVASHPVPPDTYGNGYAPSLVPEEDSVLLSDKTKAYAIFRQKTYKYAPNEVDKFRLKVSMDSTQRPTILEYRIVIHVRDGVDTFQIASDRHYFIGQPISIKPVQQRAIAAETDTLLSALGSMVRFPEIDAAIQHGDVRGADRLISARIAAIKRMAGARQRYDDGGPDLSNSLQVRSMLRIYLKDYEAGRRDIEEVVAEDPTLNRNELLANFFKVKERLQVVPDGGLSALMVMSHRTAAESRERALIVYVPDVQINPPSDWKNGDGPAPNSR